MKLKRRKEGGWIAYSSLIPKLEVHAWNEIEVVNRLKKAEKKCLEWHPFDIWWVSIIEGLVTEPYEEDWSTAKQKYQHIRFYKIND